MGFLDLIFMRLRHHSLAFANRKELFFDTNAWCSLSTPFLLPAFRCFLSSPLRQQTTCHALGPTAVRGHALKAAELTSNIVVRYIHRLYLRDEGPMVRGNSKTRLNAKASSPCDHDLAVVGGTSECCVRCKSSVQLQPMYLFTASLIPP